jgi:hypothetical protein
VSEKELVRIKYRKDPQDGWIFAEAFDNKGSLIEYVWLESEDAARRQLEVKLIEKGYERSGQGWAKKPQPGH